MCPRWHSELFRLRDVMITIALNVREIFVASKLPAHIESRAMLKKATVFCSPQVAVPFFPEQAWAE